jgi:hypothetical protein
VEAQAVTLMLISGRAEIFGDVPAMQIPSTCSPCGSRTFVWLAPTGSSHCFGSSLLTSV